MFSIKSNKLLEANQNFENIENILYHQYEILREVIYRLSEFSDMEESIVILKKIGVNITDFGRSTNQLKNTLNDIVNEYKDSDMRVRDEYENANIHIRFKSISEVNVKNIQQFLDYNIFKF